MRRFARFMSSVSNLSKTFAETLKLGSSEAAPVAQQSADSPALKLTFPGDLPVLNDLLRSETYLSAKNAASDVDAVVLARVFSLVKEFKQADVVAHRHIIRWVDQLQHELGIEDKLVVDHDLAAEREIKKKEKKDAKPKDGEAKKDAKKDNKKAAKSDATAETVAAATTATADGAAAGPKKEKKEKKPKAPKAQPVAAPITPGRIDLRVGFIKKAIRHPDADSLYVSTIDVGEEEPRTICSGLVNFVPIEDMQERYIVVFANLKPVKMRGIVSNGMVLCASTHDHTKVEFINPPAGSKPGDKIFFEGFDEEPDAQLNPKKKVWETLQPDVTTNDDFEVTYSKDGKVHKLINKTGDLFKASTIKQANVS